MNPRTHSDRIVPCGRKQKWLNKKTKSLSFHINCSSSAGSDICDPSPRDGCLELPLYAPGLFVLLLLRPSLHQSQDLPSAAPEIIHLLGPQLFNSHLWPPLLFSLHVWMSYVELDPAVFKWHLHSEGQILSKESYFRVVLMQISVNRTTVEAELCHRPPHVSSTLLELLFIKK